MSALSSLFKKPDPRAQLRSSQREISRNFRDIEREILALQREEAKCVKDVKAAAAVGNMKAVKILAQQVVRMRNQKGKLQSQAASLRGVTFSMATASTTGTVAKSLGSASKAMAAVTSASDLRNAQISAQEFARQSYAMEVADDILDSALDADEVEEEADDVVNQVLDEIGVDIGANLVPAGKDRVAAPAVRQPVSHEDQELEAQIAALTAKR